MRIIINYNDNNDIVKGLLIQFNSRITYKYIINEKVLSYSVTSKDSNCWYLIIRFSTLKLRLYRYAKTFNSLNKLVMNGFSASIFISIDALAQFTSPNFKWSKKWWILKIYDFPCACLLFTVYVFIFFGHFNFVFHLIVLLLFIFNLKNNKRSIAKQNFSYLIWKCIFIHLCTKSCHKKWINDVINCHLMHIMTAFEFVNNF